MGFKKVNVNNTKKATDLSVGDALIGYVVRTEESSNYPGRHNLVIQEKGSGEEYLLFGAGNLNYMVSDGKIREGLLTRITRNEDKAMKNGKGTRSDFTVEQDSDDTMGGVATVPKATNTTSVDIKGRAAALKAKVSNG